MVGSSHGQMILYFDDSAPQSTDWNLRNCYSAVIHVSCKDFCISIISESYLKQSWSVINDLAAKCDGLQKEVT